VDIAIRGGLAPDERVLAVKLMDNHFIPVAAPSYLRAAGTPQHAFELLEHRGIYYRTPQGPNPWLCEIEGRWHNVAAPQVVVSNSSKWLVAKVIAGEGIMMAPRWSLRPYLESGELKELTFDPELRVSQSSAMAVYLLYQKQRYQVPKVKVAVDFLTQRIHD
jgi:DNA-binding transcriptional LysR family regulator